MPSSERGATDLIKSMLYKQVESRMNGGVLVMGVCLLGGLSERVIGLSVYLSCTCRMSGESECGSCVFGSLLKSPYQPSTVSWYIAYLHP